MDTEPEKLLQIINNNINWYLFGAYHLPLDPEKDTCFIIFLNDQNPMH